MIRFALNETDETCESLVDLAWLICARQCNIDGDADDDNYGLDEIAKVTRQSSRTGCQAKNFGRSDAVITRRFLPFSSTNICGSLCGIFVDRGATDTVTNLLLMRLGICTWRTSFRYTLNVRRYMFEEQKKSREKLKRHVIDIQTRSNTTVPTAQLPSSTSQSMSVCSRAGS